MVAVAVPEGPKGGRIMGNMREFNRDTLAFVERCAREFGDVVLTRFLYVPAYFLFNPEHIEYVLATGSKNFVKPMSLRSPFFLRLVGNGLVTSEGEFWRRQRRLAQPAFHRDRVASYGETMVEFTERTLAGWREGEERDAHVEMMRLTQNIVVKTLFTADVSAEADEIGGAASPPLPPLPSQRPPQLDTGHPQPTPRNPPLYR